MKKLSCCFVMVLVLAAGALAAPRGLSGLCLGIGAGGIGDGYVQGEFDFPVSHSVCLGPELALGFGGWMSGYLGGAGRWYFIPDNAIFQPGLAFSAGLAHAFDNNSDNHPFGDNSGWTGAYFRAAVGCDFDIPNSPVSPYVDLGGMFLAGDGSDSDLNAELGIRIER